MPKLSMIRLNAGHDSNGHPRRLYIGMHPEGVKFIHDENYGGLPPVTLSGGAYCLMDIDTTPKEYRRLISFAKSRKIFSEG